MADIVYQCGHAEEFFDIVRRGDILHHSLEERVEMARKPACDVHGPERMDEAAVFCRGIDPAGALELINVAETLDPGRIDQIFFRPFMWIRNGIRNGERDVLVDRIGDERRAVIGRVGWMIGCLHTSVARSS